MIPAILETGLMHAGLGHGGFADTVLAGSLLAAIPVAILAGLVSFASPCVVPLVPGYLGYVSGMAGAGAEGHSHPVPRLVLGASLFVLGFTAVFVTLGVAVGSIGSLVTPHIDLILRVLGVIVVVMGMAFMGSVSFLQSERRLHFSPRAGLWGAPLLGATFGLGWTPCIGPTLSAVFALALNEQTVSRGALLAVAYSIGLGAPFIALAFSAQKSFRVLGWLKRHRRALMQFGGAVLVLLGALLVTGVWQQFTGWLQAFVQDFAVAV